MKCPECGRGSQVLDTRKRHDGSILRRRRCTQDHTFSTVEAVYFNRQRPALGGPMTPDQFKALQHMLGLTNRALEIMLNVSDQTVTNWRNGHSRIPGSAAMLLHYLSESHPKSPESSPAA